jgi:protein-S-isoprenylcysteine O-methyltransferase Ste14
MPRLEELRYLVFGRAVPAALFALLGYRVLLNLVAQVQALPTPTRPLDIAAGPLPTALYFVFCTLPVAIYLTRPRPRARDGRAVARIAGLAGTVMLLIVGAFPNPVLLLPPEWVRTMATPLTIVGFAIAVYGLLHLRRSLSIIPEARRLVTTGPYTMVRHPLYMAEMVVSIAVVLSRPALWAVIALPAFIAVQLLRAHFEEGLLSRTFSEYRGYAARTARLIPFVW